MDSLRQEAVAELARRCVIQGKADGSFGYADPLQRCDGAVLLMRVLEQVDNSCRGESQTVTLHILNADTGEALLPDQQVETEVSTYLSSLANGLDPWATTSTTTTGRRHRIPALPATAIPCISGP